MSLATRLGVLLLAIMLFAMPGQAWAQRASPTGKAAVEQSAVVDPGYILGVNDTVTVTVYGQPEFNVTTRIKPDGTVVMPLIGPIQANGRTVLSLADDIKKILVQKGFLKDPIVNVEIGNYASKTVNVAGRVSRPGVYPLDQQYRVLEMLLKAGWVQNIYGDIYLRRGSDYTEITLKTEQLVRGGPDKNPVLQPGDTLFVPDPDTFIIYGQVSRPGTYPLMPGMTIREAIATAGGVTALGSEKKVAIAKPGQKDVAAKPEDLVAKGDIVFVKERTF